MGLGTVLSPIFEGIDWICAYSWRYKGALDSADESATPAAGLSQVAAYIFLSVPAQYFSLSSRFIILPAAFLGSVSMNSTDLGDL
jgi:hypothetical protein